MRRKIGIAGAIACAVMTAWTPLSAGAQQEPPPAASPGDGDIVAGLSAHRVIGSTIRDAEGEALGEVHDIILSHGGRAKEIVVALGGFLGVGEDFVIIPYEWLTFGRDDVVLIGASRRDLETRQRFSYPDEEQMLIIAVPAEGEGAEDEPERWLDRPPREYLDETRDKMQDWERKVEDFTGDVRREGREAATQAKQTVADRWQDVEQQWQRLENAGDEAWQEAQQGFQRAWQSFEQAWDRAETEGAR